MKNIEKALSLINTFATGDTNKAAELLAEGYIQHNLAYGTGRDAFVGSVSYLASAPVKTTVNNTFARLRTAIRYFFRPFIILREQVNRWRLISSALTATKR